MRKRLIWEAGSVCAVCLVCGGMAAICIYMGQTLGVAAWLALGVSTALHVRRGRVSLAETQRIAQQLWEGCEAQIQAEVARHKIDLNAAYREALERHKLELGRGLQ